MRRHNEPQLTLTASGRAIELPKCQAGGNPVAAATGQVAAEMARDWIRRGDLDEALVWLERAGFDGLRVLVERRA